MRNSSSYPFSFHLARVTICFLWRGSSECRVPNECQNRFVINLSWRWGEEFNNAHVFDGILDESLVCLLRISPSIRAENSWCLIASIDESRKWEWSVRGDFLTKESKNANFPVSQCLFGACIRGVLQKHDRRIIHFQVWKQTLTESGALEEWVRPSFHLLVSINRRFLKLCEAY